MEFDDKTNKAVNAKRIQILEDDEINYLKKISRFLQISNATNNYLKESYDLISHKIFLYLRLTTFIVSLIS